MDGTGMSSNVPLKWTQVSSHFRLLSAEQPGAKLCLLAGSRLARQGLGAYHPSGALHLLLTSYKDTDKAQLGD